jgi:phage terminase large subunit
MPVDVKPQHVFHPRGAAREIFERTDAEVLISGPAGTGKSRACLEKLHILALRHPRMRGLIVRKTLSSLASTALETWRRYVAPEAIVAGDVEYYGGSAEEPPQYRYANGSTIIIGGMDKASRIMSSEYDVVYVQEATELYEDDWEAITTRLRNWVIPFQQIIGDCNPSTPYHWLLGRVKRGQVGMLLSRHEDNPELYDETSPGHFELTLKGSVYMQKLDALTGVRRQRLRDGLWVAAEGIIYEEWNELVHLVEPFDIPDDWPRWWGVDFGFVNPFALGWWAEDPDGGLYLYREIYHSGRTVEEHCEKIARQVMTDLAEKERLEAWQGRWTEPQPRAILADHAAENREVFERELGLRTDPANKAVLDGIQAVQVRLKAGRVKLFKGARIEKDHSLEEAHRPTCTAEEIVGYAWDIGAGKRTKEVPRKEDDHGMDQMRYVVVEKDLTPRPRVRWLS